MDIYVYSNEKRELLQEAKIGDLSKYLDDPECVVWVDMPLYNEDEKASAKKILYETFQFHRLTIKDCLGKQNQPKAEEFDSYVFFVLHGVDDKSNSMNFETKEISGYLGKNFLVTCHNHEFESIRKVKKSVNASSQSIKRGAPFLLYQVFDQLTDFYMPIIDDFDDNFNKLEDEVYERKSTRNNMLEKIMGFRRSVAHLKRVSTRQLEVLLKFSDGQFAIIPENDLPYFRDVQNHLLRISDLAESYRELISSLFDIHLNVTANKTNDVMKVLAVYNAVLLPLSLIAGIFGMNFEVMPGLSSPNGYFAVLFLMATIAFGLMVYFWWKGWFTND